MLSCKQVTRLVSEGLDRDLPLDRRLAVRLHVLLCGACRAYRRQVILLNALVCRRFSRGSARLPGGPSLSAEARERIQASLKKRDA